MILPGTLCWALLIAAAHFILSLFGPQNRPPFSRAEM